jgi:hypothetical protein
MQLDKLAGLVAKWPHTTDPIELKHCPDRCHRCIVEAWLQEARQTPTVHVLDSTEYCPNCFEHRDICKCGYFTAARPAPAPAHLFECQCLDCVAGLSTKEKQGRTQAAPAPAVQGQETSKESFDHTKATKFGPPSAGNQAPAVARFCEITGNSAYDCRTEQCPDCPNPGPQAKTVRQFISEE